MFGLDGKDSPNIRLRVSKNRGYAVIAISFVVRGGCYAESLVRYMSADFLSPEQVKSSCRLRVLGTRTMLQH